MREALEAVLFPRDLDYDVQGNLIRVFARKPTTRLYPIDYLNMRRASERRVQSSPAVAGKAPSADLTSAIRADRYEELTKGITELLSSSGRAHVDRTAGLVHVTDFADRLDRVGAYLEAAQLRANRQVRIEARVFEVLLKDPAAGSIDWHAVVPPGTSVASGRNAGLMVEDVGALMRAIGEQGTIRTIAAPQLVVTNNEPAILRAGTEDVYFVSATDTDASGRSRQSTIPSTVTNGFTLNVVAQIASDGVVQLAVAPTYSEKSGESIPKRGDAVPVMSIAAADTVVRVRDGETVVLSGFLRRRDVVKQGTGMSGIFGSQKHEMATGETVVLLTPRVVGPAADRSQR